MSKSFTPRLLILGATGRLGRSLIREALQQGYGVVATGRNHKRLEEALRDMVLYPGLELQEVGLGQHDRLRPVFEKVDWVIDARNQRYDNWSGYPNMISETIRALDDAPRPYIYVDNVYCYGRPATNPVPEDALRRPISEKGRIRVSVEKLLFQAMSSGHTVMVTRYPDFYGPGIEPFSSLESGTLSWFGNPTLPHQFVHVRDAAGVLLALVANSESYGQLWHIPGPKAITGLDAYHLAQRISLKPIRLRVIGPLTVWVLGFINSDARGFRETRYLWDTPLILDGTKFLKQYGDGWFRSHEDTFEEILVRYK